MKTLEFDPELPSFVKFKYVHPSIKVFNMKDKQNLNLVSNFDAFPLSSDDEEDEKTKQERNENDYDQWMKGLYEFSFSPQTHQVFDKLLVLFSEKEDNYSIGDFLKQEEDFKDSSSFMCSEFGSLD